MKANVMFHCGNAPKMETVINLTIALAKKDAAEAQKHVREDFTWKTVGKDDTIKYEELATELPKRPAVKELTVENALSHGDGAMCEGTLVFEDGDELYFCNVVKFVNTAKDALVKGMYSYFVK